MRRYSALAVVVASVFLVATNNISLRHSERDSSNKTLSRNFTHGISALSTHNSVALLPHINSSLSAEERNEEEIVAESLETLTHTSDTSALAYLSGQSFIAAAHAMDIQRDPEESGSVQLHEVQSGETISSIASSYGITVNTLYWANNIDDIDEIMPGDTLFILPVAGLKHTVQEDEDAEVIAEKYEVNAESIIEFNELPANGVLATGEEIIIPGAEKDIPQPEPVAPDNSLFSPRQYAGSSGKTVENRHGKANRFPYGYCTWYVAQQKYVPWRGNAGAWLYNAKAAGYATGSKPKEGAIVVTTDNTYYGHVALVTKVSSDTITVKEMNYDGWGIVNSRTISKNDRKIRGYIY